MSTLIKLGLTTFLGIVMGLERELKRKPVGLKTILVISIVSCLLTIVSIESAYIFPPNEDINIQMDPLRLAAQIVSGIGFLGAGVILRRGNDSISGLTTAAIIWGAAGIGVAVGAGFYLEAIAGVCLLIISVEILPFIFGYIGPRKLRQKEIKLKLEVRDKNTVGEVIELIKKENFSIRNIRIKDLNENGHLLDLIIAVDYKCKTTEIYYTISKINEVYGIEIESLS